MSLRDPAIEDVRSADSSAELSGVHPLLGVLPAGPGCLRSTFLTALGAPKG
jgi:hypothetical protein